MLCAAVCRLAEIEIFDFFEFWFELFGVFGVCEEVEVADLALFELAKAGLDRNGKLLLDLRILTLHDLLMMRKYTIP